MIGPKRNVITTATLLLALALGWVYVSWDRRSSEQAFLGEAFPREASHFDDSSSPDVRVQIGASPEANSASLITWPSSVEHSKGSNLSPHEQLLDLAKRYPEHSDEFDAFLLRYGELAFGDLYIALTSASSETVANYLELIGSDQSRDENNALSVASTTPENPYEEALFAPEQVWESIHYNESPLANDPSNPYHVLLSRSEHTQAQ